MLLALCSPLLLARRLSLPAKLSFDLSHPYLLLPFDAAQCHALV